MKPNEELPAALGLIVEQIARGDEVCRAALNMAASCIEHAIAERRQLLDGLRDAYKTLERSIGRGPGFEPDWARMVELRNLLDER